MRITEQRQKKTEKIRTAVPASNLYFCLAVRASDLYFSLHFGQNLIIRLPTLLPSLFWFAQGSARHHPFTREIYLFTRLSLHLPARQGSADLCILKVKVYYCNPMIKWWQVPYGAKS